MKPCRELLGHLECWLDGELGADKTLEVEEHLVVCEACAERARLERAIRGSLRRAVRSDTEVSPELLGRFRAAMAAEVEREAAVPVERREPQPLRRWLVPALAAAAAAAVVLRVGKEHSFDAAGRRGVAAAASTGALGPPALAGAGGALAASIDQVLDQLVDYHARPPMHQITEPNLVGKLEPEVGVPVRLPIAAEFGAEWEGGSVVLVRDQRAAFIRYRLSNHPVTVYIYDARRVPLGDALEQRVVNDRRVHVGAHRGYSIAAREQRGIGYAIASDLDDAESAELVASIR